MNPQEADYLATRSELLMSQSGLTRRDVLRMGAVLSVAAGVAQFAPPGMARAAAAAACHR
jgi:hypothetical protein